MAILVVVHPLIRRIYNRVFRSAVADSSNTKIKTDGPTHSVAADLRLKQRVQFDFWFALIFIAALHGVSILKILAILYVNYSIATRLPRRYVPTVTWVFNIGILFANELSKGYPFAKIAGVMAPPGENGTEAIVVTWGKWLDGHGGLISRWEVLFKITILRLVAFNFDYYWSLDHRSGSPIEVCVFP